MGVSGSGKTSIGQILASRLSLPFFDADDFHSKENKDKMRNGIALNDADREPWLIQLSSLLQDQEMKSGCVLACSALKEKYREILKKEVKSIAWVYLEGTKEVLQERLQKRSHAFMSPALIDSQLATMEKPSYALTIPITLTPEKIIEEIIDKIKSPMKTKKQFGLIGLGVMGRNLALNLLDKGVALSVFNRHIPGKEEDVAKKFAAENPQSSGYDDLALFVSSLEKPRKIFFMIKAGEAVDELLTQLIPMLEKGDVLMDGGNSHFLDTKRRSAMLSDIGIEYLGVGVSGGEEGARKGPSIMPGGKQEAYRQVAPFFELISAKDKNNKPCCTYVGPEGAGHFVKMVHNGIEYAEMQIIAEIYYLMKNSQEYTPEKMIQTFEAWEKEGLGSFLLEITKDILRKKEGNELLLDKILDAAEQKGTGGWSVKTAMDLGIPLSTITDAVTARILSSFKSARVKADQMYKIKDGAPKLQISEQQLKHAYKAARIINHAIGFGMIYETSKYYGWKVNQSELARIWTNGCIIRSAFMENLIGSFQNQDQLLLQPQMVEALRTSWKDLSVTVSQGLQSGLALPVLSASLNYFLGYVSAESPANLIQAQRDFFGAHTYRRIDKGEQEYFHTVWKS